MAEPQAAIDGNGDDRRALVVVFLRGGADGLNMVPPVEEDDYHRARPVIGVAKKDALALDGFFGLNPKLKDLKPLYDEGDLAIVHAAGSEDSTRSHFEAQDLMEHGGIGGGGWLGRFLRFRDEPARSALSAVALGRSVPECLRGAPAAAVMESLDDFALGEGSEAFAGELEKLYAAETGPLGGAARDTLDALRRIESLRGKPYSPANGAEYPTDDFGRGLSQVARLIRARVGLKAASIDLGGWDSHFAQTTLMDPLMERLGAGLAAFRRDMGGEMAETTVVVMTEFGRRVAQNSALGTDHGRAGAMFALGGGIVGGRVVGEWPTLDPSRLASLTDALDVAGERGDLKVATNYRNVLAPILARHGAKDMAAIFPNFEIEPLGLFQS